MTDQTAINRRNRRRGADWETELLRGFREHGMDVERLRLTGRNDEGDLAIRTDGDGGRVVVEAKAGAMHLAEFVRQAQLEADNYTASRPLHRANVTGVAIVKARGKNWRDAYVVTTVREYFGLDFCD